MILIIVFIEEFYLFPFCTIFFFIFPLLHLSQRVFYRIKNLLSCIYTSFLYLNFGKLLIIIKCILQSCIPSRVSLLPKPFSVDLCGCRNLNVVSPECGATSAHPLLSLSPFLSTPASLLFHRWNWLKFMAFAARARKLFAEISLRDLSLILTRVHLAACRNRNQSLTKRQVLTGCFCTLWAQCVRVG